MTDTAATLPPGVVFQVEDLARRHTRAHDARYTPTVGLLTLLKDKRMGFSFASIANMGGGDDEDDGGDEDEEALSEPTAALPKEYAFAGISFRVPAGTAFGVVGSSDSGAGTLARVLAGMVTPTRGRILVRGRIAPSVEFAREITRRENHPRRALLALATVSGIPFRLRKAYVRQGLDLLAADPLVASGKRGGKSLVRAVAIAAALDPFADVLIVDELPPRTHKEIHAECEARIRAALERGAAAVITAPDPEFIRSICTDAILLDKGRLVGAGAASDMVDAFEQGGAPGRPPAADDHPAGDVDVLEAQVGLDGEGVAEGAVADGIRLRLETRHADLVVSCRACLRGAEQVRFVQAPVSLPRPGAYDVTLRPGASGLPRGSYDVDVAVVSWRDGDEATLSLDRVLAIELTEGVDFPVTENAARELVSLSAWSVQPV